MRKDRLIHVPASSSPDDNLDDCFLVMAGTIEDSIISARAIPGKDYSILDLYKLAEPFVLHKFKQPSSTMAITRGWIDPEYAEKQQRGVDAMEASTWKAKLAKETKKKGKKVNCK